MKRLLLVALVLSIGIGVTAQSVGLRVGYTMSGLRIDDSFSDYLTLVDIQGKLTNGVNIGIVFEKPINKKIDLHAELNFAQKGSAYDMYANTDNNGTSGYGETNLNYFELPLMAKIKFGPAYVAVGPHIGVLLSATEINFKENDNLVAAFEAGLLTGTPMSADAAAGAAAAALGVEGLANDEFVDMEMDNFNAFDFGGQFTIGAQFPVGPVILFGEARSTVAFTNWETWNTFDQTTLPASEFEFKKNMAFTFSVGVLFGKPKK